MSIAKKYDEHHKMVYAAPMDTHIGKKEQTHERIVDAAARAIRRSGFAGVGVADVMKEAGLTHGGFYAHFDSREALLSEALARAGAAGAAALARRVETRRQQGATALHALIESYLSEAHLAGTESGCPVAALASEMPRQSAELREASVQRVQAMIDSVRQALPAPRSKHQATAIVCTMVGALQMARVLGSNAKGKALLAAAREALLTAHVAR